METKVQKWGNSLGVRIPRAFAAEARVEAGSTIEISVENGTLKIRPARRLYSLAQLLKKVTPRNRHAEVRTGPAMGREAW